MPPTNDIDERTVRAVEPMLMAVATRAVRNGDLARDLVQETYVAAIQGLSRFEGRSSLRTWMVGILGRKIVDHFRRQGREVVTDQPPELEAPSRFAPLLEPSPLRRLQDRTALRVLEQALGSLSQQERMAVMLCDVEQLGRDEARAIMAVQPTHLRVLLHRGRHKLRRALEEQECGP